MSGLFSKLAWGGPGTIQERGHEQLMDDADRKALLAALIRLSAPACGDGPRV